MAKPAPSVANAKQSEVHRDAPAASGSTTTVAGLRPGGAATKLANPRIIVPTAFVLLAIGAILVFKGTGGSVSVSQPKAPEVVAPLSAQQERTLASGDPFQECFSCPVMVAIPAGNFMMGTDSDLDRESVELPVHQVTVKRFAAARYAVTYDEWDACASEGACEYKKTVWDRGRQPVVNVTWWETRPYVQWLSAKTKMNYRLLSEAEREYATRAGTTTAFWWGKSISTADANYNGSRTVSVQSFKPNPFGLYQVHGNVWEWVEDCWFDNYQRAPSDGSAVGGGCSNHTLRGGSWTEDARRLRSASRRGYASNQSATDIGFRVARSLTP
jgi:formylglycine-generating enzyme required for sulfatase activity